MARTQISKKYFEWMYDIVCGGRFAQSISYKKLLKYLHDIEFTWTIPKDANRAEDGIDLRYRYGYFNNIEDIHSCITGPCSVLEMMVALAIRCEEDIMDDPKMGDRTGQWFWRMINNMELGAMNDDRFDQEYVWSQINIMLNREYEPDGRGGLFVVRHCDYDMRYVEIWAQLSYSLGELM